MHKQCKRVIRNRQLQLNFDALKHGTFGWGWYSPMFAKYKPVKVRLYVLCAGKIATTLTIRRVRKVKREYLPH